MTSQAPHRRPLTIAALVPAALLLGACGSRTPTAPSPPTVSAVAISGVPPGFSVGETAQLRASATFSDSHTSDVTTAVRWATTTLACLVSPSGMATAVTEGPCGVRATYEGVTGSLDLTVQPSTTFRVSGVVRERWEARQRPIAGAVVVLASGPQAGRSLTTGTAGEFRFDGVPVGTVTLRAQAEGFDSGSVEASPQLPSVDVVLAPTIVTFRLSLDGASPLVDRPFDVSHEGPVTLTTFSPVYECGTYETMAASVKDSSGTEVVGTYPCPPNVPKTVEKVLPPGRYVLHAWAMWTQQGRWVEVKHPK